MNLFRNNPPKTLTRLIALNIVFEIVAIAIWNGLPGSEGNLHYINKSVASIEAAIAAMLFTITLFGLVKKKWAPKTVISITIIQRIFATTVFFQALEPLRHLSGQ